MNGLNTDIGGDPPTDFLIQCWCNSVIIPEKYQFCSLIMIVIPCVRGNSLASEVDIKSVLRHVCKNRFVHLASYFIG